MAYLFDDIPLDYLEALIDVTPLDIAELSEYAGASETEKED